MDILTRFGIVAAVVGGTYAVFKALEETASSDAKSALTRWLQETNFVEDRTHSIHDVLTTTFVSIFEPLFSVKFVARTFLISFTCAGSLFVLAYAGFKNPSVFLFQRADFPFIFWGAVLCTPIDILSFAKSSIIIRTTDFRQHVFGYYALDIMISFLMAFGWAIVVTIVGPDIVGRSGEKTPLDGAPAALITSLIPTLLIFSFLMSAIIAKWLVKLGKPFEFAKSRMLNIAEKPFQSLGILVSLLVLIASSIVILRAG